MSDLTAIAPLTKVALKLTVSSEATANGASLSGVDFSFVYGIGTQGLSGFEMDLTGKHTGDGMQLHVDPVKMDDYFEHLGRPLLKALNIEPPFDLDLTIREVSRVSERELITAMAQTGGDGGGCGCGCDACG
jgi:hypothetical protein